LDAVRDIAHRPCNAAVLRDEIEQLQVVNVHDRNRR
jgi:hypothetical protein